MAANDDLLIGVVVQLVRIPACHAGGRGFESRPYRSENQALTKKFVGAFSVWCKQSENINREWLCTRSVHCKQKSPNPYESELFFSGKFQEFTNIDILPA